MIILMPGQSHSFWDKHSFGNFIIISLWTQWTFHGQLKPFTLYSAIFLKDTINQIEKRCCLHMQNISIQTIHNLLVAHCNRILYQRIWRKCIKLISNFSNILKSSLFDHVQHVLVCKESIQEIVCYDEHSYIHDILNNMNHLVVKLTECEPNFLFCNESQKRKRNKANILRLLN